MEPEIPLLGRIRQTAYQQAVFTESGIHTESAPSAKASAVYQTSALYFSMWKSVNPEDSPHTVRTGDEQKHFGVEMLFHKRKIVFLENNFWGADSLSMLAPAR